MQSSRKRALGRDLDRHIQSTITNTNLPLILGAHSHNEVCPRQAYRFPRTGNKVGFFLLSSAVSIRLQDDLLARRGRATGSGIP